MKENLLDLGVGKKVYRKEPVRNPQGSALMDTRIRGIDKKTWALFKKHCQEESKKRGKPISCNKRLLEMIDMVIATS